MYILKLILVLQDIGFMYNDSSIFEAIKFSEFVNITGCFTHFSKPKDEKWTRLQFSRFNSLFSEIKEINSEIKFHACGSTAFLKYEDMWLDYVRLGSCLQGRVLDNSLGLRKIGILTSEIVLIKNIPKGYNIGYSNEYTAKKNMKIAVVNVGYIDGFNLKKERDSFNLKDNFLSILIQIKKMFTDNRLKVKLNENYFYIVGRLGMFHLDIDISNAENIKIGDKVYFDVSPMYVNSNIRREYI